MATLSDTYTLNRRCAPAGGPIAMRRNPLTSATMPPYRVQRTMAAIVVVGVIGAGLSCRREDDAAAPLEPVLVYCSVDESFARNVLAEFSRRTGIPLQPVFDSEAGKTTGLVNRIIAEARSGRPRADVFWSSEIFNTILLARDDLLTPYESPAAADIPQAFRDRRHRWTGVSVRARVIACRLDGSETAAVPAQWEQMADPGIAPTMAIANPLFGTTRGHVAAMFALWGSDRARAFLTSLRERGAQVLDSNSATVRAVMAGRVECAATDSDDVWVALAGGATLSYGYPDMGDGGTLLIPCSVAIVQGSRHLESSKRLVDFLVSADVERLLAASDSRNIPVREAVRESLGLTWPPASKISLDAVADAMAEAEVAVREILLR